MTIARSDWFATAHGRNVWLLEPARSEVHIEDIAISLARQTRFAGHYKPGIGHYSVAQHSVIVSHAVVPELALAALLHDAAEAYLQDIIRPLKREIGERYEELESMWSTRINRAFGLADFADMHEDIKRADVAALMAEKRDLLCPPLCDWQAPVAPLHGLIVPWDARTAYALFMSRFHALYTEPSTPAALRDFSPDTGERP